MVVTVFNRILTSFLSLSLHDFSEGILLIQGLLSRVESLPTQKLEKSWPGQRLDWTGDVRTQVEINMMGI